MGATDTRRRRRAAPGWWTVAALGALACTTPERALTLQVSGIAAEVQALAVSATLAGQSLPVPEVASSQAQISIPLASGAAGLLLVEVEGLREDRCVIARGQGQASVGGEARVELAVALQAEATPDCRRRPDAATPADASTPADAATPVDAAQGQDGGALPKCGAKVTACGAWMRAAPNQDLGCGAVVLCTPDPKVCTKGRAPAHDILQTEKRTCTDMVTGALCEERSSLVTQACGFNPGCPC